MNNDKKTNHNYNGNDMISMFLGIITVVFSLYGLIFPKDSTKSIDTTCQMIYMFLILGGGFSNLVDCGGGLFAKLACLFYLSSAILSIVANNTLANGFRWNPVLISFALIISLLRVIIIYRAQAKEPEEFEEKSSDRRLSVDLFLIDEHEKREAKANLERYAHKILEDVKWNGDEVNKSLTVFDFVYSYTKVINGLEELVRLNEVEGVSMTPPPKEDLDRIRGGVELTINKFIDRSIESAKQQGDVGIENLLSEMIDDADFWSLATAGNKSKINKILNGIERKRAEEKDRIAQAQETERKKKLLDKIGVEPVDCSELDPMDVIKQMEYRLEFFYNSFKKSAQSPETGSEMFLFFKKACETSKLPLAAEVRLESLLNEYESKFHIPNPLYFVDKMNGREFEEWCSNLLKRNGFTNVEVTRGSGDQGVDVLAEKDGLRYAFQCKCYSSDLGNKPVQEVHAGKYIYQCHVGVVITNRYFTQGAKDAAKATGILLWDRDRLRGMIAAAE